MTEWIKCSESLPEVDEMVIAACYGSDIIRPNEGEGFWNGADYFPMIIAPTFWQPLPKPPIPQPPKDGEYE